MNATCECLVSTLHRGILDRVLILGEAHMHIVLTEYQVHYNTARLRQGISQRDPNDEPDAPHATMTDVDSGLRAPERRPLGSECFAMTGGSAQPFQGSWDSATS